MEEIKRLTDNFLESRVYNFYNAKKKKKAISNDRRKYKLFYDNLSVVENLKKYLNRQILIKNNTKKSFIDLHYLKMLEHYLYLRFYHENFQKLPCNEKLLCYFENILDVKGFNPKTWDEDYNLVDVLENIVYFLKGC